MAQLWWVYGGMGAGFGGPKYLGDLEADSREEAINESWSLVVEDYESYAGYHGIPSFDECREELLEELCDEGEEPDDEDVQTRYEETISNWTSHWVREAIPGADPEDFVDQPVYE